MTGEQLHAGMARCLSPITGVYKLRPKGVLGSPWFSAQPERRDSTGRRAGRQKPEEILLRDARGQEPSSHLRSPAFLPPRE
jgi:hypothetical protein